jgi:CsoR family transcriptional regulator, copper-sensing transcriptional repressor
MDNKELTKKAMAALKRIQGQVGGVYKMLEDGRYCIDVVTQIAAVESALKEVRMTVLKRHMNSCVLGSLNSKNPRASKEKIDELIAVFSKFGK